MKKFSVILSSAAVSAFLVTGLTACANTGAPANGEATDQIEVYATTGYLADAVAHIAPDAVVTTMVGPGGDPHTYQPSTKDIEKIQSADVVFWNGLHLEAQMIDQLESLGERQLAVGEQIPTDLLLEWPETDEQGNALHDPHIWNSPEAWTLVVGYVADKLSEIDPENAGEYVANSEAYLAQIDTAVAETEALLGDGMLESRILITGHDAFAYFGQTFGLDVRATDFISTEAKLSASELSELAELIAKNTVPVIFQDNQANPQAITSLKEAVTALGWNVQISQEELFADSLGAEAPMNTYIGALTHNAHAVADALQKEAQ